MEDNCELKFLQVDTTTILSSDMLKKMYTTFEYNQKAMNLCTDADKHYCIMTINFDYKNNFIKKACDLDDTQALKDFSDWFIHSIFNYKRFMSDEDIFELYNEALELFQDYELNANENK